MSGHEYILRDASATDLPEVVRIYNESVAGRRACVTVHSRQAWFDAHTPERDPFVVACPRGRASEIVGWTCLQPYHLRDGYWPTAEVRTYISTAHHGRGLGTLLRGEILARSRNLAIDRVISVVFTHHHASRRLNQKFGFEQWGLLPGVVDLPARAVMW
ncbi:MAG: GNAT family N-acetyltransferase [Nannocystaceae bacterium]